MRRENLIFLFVLAVVCLITYAGMLDNGFKIDAHVFRVDQPLDQRFERLADFFTAKDNKHFYPLYYLINISLQRLFPENPFAQNSVNLLLFYGNCALLFFIALALTKSRPVAALAAILFCIHPFNADNISHTDISNTLVAGLCLQGAFLALLSFLNDTAKRGRYWLGIILFIIALLCGEPALMFPLYLLALIFIAKKENISQTAKLCLPFFLIAAIFVLFLNARADPSAQLARGWTALKITPFEYAASVSHLIFWYIKNLVFPGGIFLIYNTAPLKEAAAVINLTLLALLIILSINIVKRRGRSAAAFAYIWFLSGFLFVLPASLAHAYMGLIIEPYWLFFPSMGAFLFMAIIVTELKGKVSKGIFYMLLAAIIALFSVRTQEKNFIASKESLYAYHWLKYAPGNLTARLILSSYYEEEAVLVAPRFFDEMAQTADIFINTQTYDRAIKLINKLRVSVPQTHTLQGLLQTKLALIYYQQGNLTRAEQMLIACLQKYPQEKEAYILLGAVLANLNRFDDAIAVWERGFLVDPSDPRFQFHIQNVKKLLR